MPPQPPDPEVEGAVRVVGHEPIFRVTDVRRATAFYRSLGCTIEYYDDGYAFAHAGPRLTIHLEYSEDPSPAALYVHVADADAVVAAWRTAGIDVEDTRDYDWGKHESHVLDPDGNLIRFGSPSKAHRHSDRS